MQLPAFYPIFDSETTTRRGVSALAAVEQMLEAAARILQFRHQTFFSRDVFDQLMKLSRGALRNWLAPFSLLCYQRQIWP